MSTAQTIAGHLNEPLHLLLPDAAVNDVLSMAAGRTDAVVVTGIIIVNADSAARVVNVWVTQDTTDRLIFRKSVAQDTTETEALVYPIRLDAKRTARKIRAQAASATANTVTITLIYATSSQSGAAGAG